MNPIRKLVVHKNRRFSVEHWIWRAAETEQEFFFVRKSDAVGVIVCVNERLLLVRQERPLLKKCLLELPGGKVEFGERPEVAVIRELEEETGIRAKKVELLWSGHPAPSLCSENVFVYEAVDLSDGIRNLDSSEVSLQNVWIEVSDVEEMIKSGDDIVGFDALIIEVWLSRRMRKD